MTTEVLHGSQWTRQQWPSLCTETCSPYIPRWTLHCISELQQSKWVYSATINATDADAQSPHNTVTYSIIGDGTAQTLFSINPATGFITTRQSMQNNNFERSSVRDITFFWYMYMHFEILPHFLHFFHNNLIITRKITWERNDQLWILIMTSDDHTTHCSLLETGYVNGMICL